MNYVIFKISLVIVIFLIMTIVFLFIYRRFHLDINGKLFWICFTFCYITGYFGYLYGLDKVAVVYEIDIPYQHKSIAVFGNYYNYLDSNSSVNAIVVTHGEKYVLNKSSEPAVFYPLAYGNISTNDNEIIFLKPDTITKIYRAGIDYYFDKIPESIYVEDSQSGEIRYCIDWLKNIK